MCREHCEHITEQCSCRGQGSAAAEDRGQEPCSPHQVFMNSKEFSLVTGDKQFPDYWETEIPVAGDGRSWRCGDFNSFLHVRRGRDTPRYDEQAVSIAHGGPQ